MKKDSALMFGFGFFVGVCLSAAIVAFDRALDLYFQVKDTKAETNSKSEDSEYTASTGEFVAKMKNERALKNAFDSTNDIKCEDQLDHMQKMIYDEKYNKPLDLSAMDLSGLNDE